MSETKLEEATAPANAGESPVPTEVQITPFDDAFRKDPYPILERLRIRIGSGGVLCTNSTAVVYFPNIDRRKIRREVIPAAQLLKVKQLAPGGRPP